MIKHEVITVVNTRLVYPIGVISGDEEYPDLDKAIQTIRNLSAQSWILNATEEAMKLGNTIYTNVILLGALLGSGVLPLDKKSMEGVLKEQLPKVFDINKVALKRGLDLVRDTTNN